MDGFGSNFRGQMIVGRFENDYMVSTLHMGMALVRSAFLHLYVCSYHLTYSDQIYVVVYVGVGKTFRLPRLAHLLASHYPMI